MWSKIFESLTFNFKQKTTNPFLGTFIIVWLFRNWSLIYALLYFPSHWNMGGRIEWIKNYWEIKNFYTDLVYSILVAFAVLIVTYTLLNFSRYIINRFEKQLTPWIYKITDKSSVVLKIEAQRLENNIIRLEKKISEERQKRIDAENEVERLEKKIMENYSTKEIEKKDNTPDPKVKENNEKRIEELKKIAIGKYKRLQADKRLYEFKDVIVKILNGRGFLSESNIPEYFTMLDIIKFKEKKYGENYYEFTQSGQILKDYAIEQDFQ